jgi:hypothetical protein
MIVFKSIFEWMLFILVVPVMIGLFSWNAYHLWFNWGDYAEKLKQGAQKYTSWYPFRNFALKHIGSRSWLWTQRFLSFIGTLVSLLFFVIWVLTLANGFPGSQ